MTSTTAPTQNTTRTVVAAWLYPHTNGIRQLYWIQDATNTNGECGFCTGLRLTDPCPGLATHLGDWHAQQRREYRAALVQVGVFEVPADCTEMDRLAHVGHQIDGVLTVPAPDQDVRSVIAVWRQQAGTLLDIEYVSGTNQDTATGTCDCVYVCHYDRVTCPLDQAERMLTQHAEQARRHPEMAEETTNAAVLTIPATATQAFDVIDAVTGRLQALGLR
jgi:hypothetical protein